MGLRSEHPGPRDAVTGDRCPTDEQHLGGRAPGRGETMRPDSGDVGALLILPRTID